MQRPVSGLSGRMQRHPGSVDQRFGTEELDPCAGLGNQVLGLLHQEFDGLPDNVVGKIAPAQEKVGDPHRPDGGRVPV